MRLLPCLTPVFFSLCLSGCIGFNAGSGYPVGVLYTSVITPHAMDRAEVNVVKSDDKHGEACASSVLGLVATGDASLDAAKKAGGITEVSSVEYKATSVLFFYWSSCTVAWGR